MKRKFTLLCLPILICTALHAQIEKGSVLLGGQISYNNTKIYQTNQPTETNESGVFSVSAGKAFKENQVWGLTFTYSPNSQHNYFTGENYGINKSTSYGAGLFFRQYQKLSGRFSFFIEAGAFYFYSKQSLKDSSNTAIQSGNQNGGTINLGPGIAFKVSKHFQLEMEIPTIASVSYNRMLQNSGNIETKQDNFGFYSSLNSNFFNSLGLGFRYMF